MEVGGGSECVGAKGDAMKLMRDFGIDVRGVVDLSDLADERCDAMRCVSE